MITTTWTVSYRVETDTLIHYHTCLIMREVHEIVRRVGFPSVIRIIQRDEDYETGYASVRDLNLTGPPHFFENDLPHQPIQPPYPDTVFEQTPMFMLEPRDDILADTPNLDMIRNIWHLDGPVEARRPEMAIPQATQQATQRVRTLEQQARLESLEAAHLTRLMDDAERNERLILRGMLPPTDMPAPAQIARTREQEDRLNILNRDSNIRGFSYEEATEWRRLMAMSPYIPDPNDPPLARRDRINVRVVRTTPPEIAVAHSNWEIEAKVNGNPLELPKSTVIRGLLAEEDKYYLPNRARRYENIKLVLSDALRQGLQPQSLHDALKAWVVATLSQGTEATSETNLDDVSAHLLKFQPATLEAGGIIYKLVPAGRVDTRPLIARVRKRALAATVVEATQIREGATRDARIVVNEATERANRVRAELEEERRRAGAVCPEWVVGSGRAHYWDGSYWNVELRLVAKVTEIRLTVSRWNTILFWDPVVSPGISFDSEANKLSCWYRLAPGNTSMHNVRTRRGYPTCTHINQERCCMELQGLPTLINSNRSLIDLEGHLSRGMRVVNLNSPLDARVGTYHHIFKSQIPDIPLKYLRYEINVNMPDYLTMARYQADNPGVTWDRTESMVEEAQGVFNVGDVAPTLAPGIQPGIQLQPLPVDLNAAAEVQRVIAVARQITEAVQPQRRD